MAKTKPTPKKKQTKQPIIINTNRTFTPPPVVEQFPFYELPDGQIIYSKESEEHEPTELYYCRFIPSSGISCVQTIRVRYIYNTSFTGTDTVTGMCQYIGLDQYNKTFFLSRKDANKALKELLKTHKLAECTKDISEEE